MTMGKVSCARFEEVAAFVRSLPLPLFDKPHEVRRGMDYATGAYTVVSCACGWCFYRSPSTDICAAIMKHADEVCEQRGLDKGAVVLVDPEVAREWDDIAAQGLKDRGITQ
jgi:hypothetical protein